MGTRVDLLHSNLPEDQVPPHAQGWPHFIGALAAALAPASAQAEAPLASAPGPTGPEARRGAGEGVAVA
ncbi:MAG: hypothetical protein ACR2MB_09010 [Acidimicrobiales bacterium]